MSDEMKAREDRQARLREAMQNLEPGAVRGRQLSLFPSRWDAFKLRAVAAIRSEWFNVAMFLVLVLGAVLWSVQASAADSEYLERDTQAAEIAVLQNMVAALHVDVNRQLDWINELKRDLSQCARLDDVYGPNLHGALERARAASK